MLMMRIFFFKLVLYFKHATIKEYLTLSHFGLVAHRILKVMTWIPGSSRHKTFKLLAETYFNGFTKQVSADVAPSNIKSRNLFQSVYACRPPFCFDVCYESWPMCCSVF